MAGCRQGCGLIRATGLGKRYRGRTAVHDVTFTAEPGTTTLVAGPNGSGKSTIFKLMTGIVAGSGTTTYGGVPWRKLPSPRRVVGVYLGSSPFHPRTRVVDHLELLATIDRVDSDRVRQVVDQFNLGDALRQRVGDLSLGTRQRLGLASAVLPDPPALLLDEPFSALDPGEADAVYTWLGSLGADGRTTVVSSHHLEPISSHVTRALFVRHGRLVADEPVAADSSLTARYRDLVG